MDDAKRARLAELRAAETERLAAEAEADEERELEERELAATLAATLGKRGVDFEIVSNKLGGVYGVRKPDTKAIRNWEQADEKKKTSLEWQIGLLRHYVEPEDKRLTWARTCAERPGLAWQTADAFVTLMGVDRDGLAKK